MPYYMNQPREYQSVVDPYIEGQAAQHNALIRRKQLEGADINQQINRNALSDYNTTRTVSNALAQNPNVTREELLRQTTGNEGIADKYIQERQKVREGQLKSIATAALALDGEDFEQGKKHIYERVLNDQERQQYGTPDKWNRGTLAAFAGGEGTIKALKEWNDLKKKDAEVITTPQYFGPEATGGKAGMYYANKQGQPVTFVRKATESDMKEKTSPEDMALIRQTIKDLPKLKVEATTQQNNIGQIDKALTLLKTGNVTGKSGQVKAFLAPYAEAIGANTQGMDDAQTFQLLARQIVGPMRLDIIGAGPVSEWEQKLMQQMSGGGGAGAQAAYELLTAYKKMAEAKIQNYNDTLQGAVSLSPDIGKIHRPVKTGATPAPESGRFAPMTATNPQTGQKIKSLDGGKTWQAM